MILAFNFFALYKLIFCFLAGGIIGLIYLLKPGPWKPSISFLRACINGVFVTGTLFILLFPVWLGAEKQIGYTDISLYSNADLHYQTVKKFKDQPIEGYLEHLPPGYAEHPEKKYPLIVFLHGLAEYGNGEDEIYRLAKIGIPREIEDRGKLCAQVDGEQKCFIALSPQKSDKEDWTVNVQRNFWHYILHGPEHYRYDPEQIFLVGLSQGSHGVWEWAHSGEPDANMLAGIVSVSGRGKEAPFACRLEENGINVWSINGADDDIVLPYLAKEEMEAARRCPDLTDAEFKQTTLPGVGHWIYLLVFTNDHTYLDPNIYEWMARTKKKHPPERPQPSAQAGL